VTRRAGFVAAFAIVAGVLSPDLASASGGRIVVIVLENKAYDQVVGSSRAPYMNGLFAQGTFFKNYAAVMHGSPHDYRAMTSGRTTGGGTGPNLFRSLESADLGWLELEESMAGPCGQHDAAKVPGSHDPLYTEQHDPAVFYRGTEDCRHDDVPMTSATFDPDALPDFTMIVPNQCDDSHTLAKGGPCPSFLGPIKASSSLGTADAWLSAVVPPLLAEPDVTVFITFDEGNDRTHQHLYAVELGAGVVPGSTDPTSYTHYGLLAGLYARFGLGDAPNAAAKATPVPFPG